MMLISAGIVNSQKENSKICVNDFKNIDHSISSNNSFLPFLSFDFHPFMDEFFHHYFKYFHSFGFIPPFGNSLPFLNNAFISRDIFEFIDNWSFFNIGETTMVNGNVINEHLHSFSNALIRSSGLSEYIDLGDDNAQYVINNNLVVSLLNLQIEK